MFSVFRHSTGWQPKVVHVIQTFKVIKIGRFKWLEHLFRIQEVDPCRKLSLLKLEGTQLIKKLKLLWLESVEEDVKNMGVRNLRRKSQNEEHWRTVLKKAKVHQGL
jgi:hypothetical protein